ncbi:hypothetical protein DV738_g4473, partial [Chaetothyriales sp. CBS 135597]
MLAYPYDYLLFHPGYFCSTCRAPKPARSKHCSLCRACIQKADHHCIWISNCVGRNNYVWFVALVASVTVQLAYGFCLGPWDEDVNWPPRGPPGSVWERQRQQLMPRARPKWWYVRMAGGAGHEPVVKDEYGRERVDDRWEQVLSLHDDDQVVNIYDLGAWANVLDVMSSVYISHLDAFSGSGSGSDNSLESLSHVVSGSIGASISNAATYPLDLIITRLQVQGLRRRIKGGNDDAGGLLRDSVADVYHHEGGLSGLYAGLRQDTVRTVADSLLFLLLYSLLRERRRRPQRLLAANNTKHNNSPNLGAVVDELAVSFVAGALTQAATTPLANVVTRKKTAGPEGHKPSTWEMVAQIQREKGVAGLWSGYSAGLVLALNPGLALVLFEALKRLLLVQRQGGVDAAPRVVTVLLAALSKAIAASLTYPFSVARSRLQHAGAKETDEVDDGRRADNALNVLNRISEREGLQNLYAGVGLEAGKQFFGHGLTLLAKQGIQTAAAQLYSVFSIVMGRYRSEVDAQRLRERARENMEYYNLGREQAADKIDVRIYTTMQSRAHETAEFIGEYVEEDSEDWKELYGTTGLDRWFKGGR